MKKYNLEFCFKGSRNYIQGPDILDKVLNKLSNEFDLNTIEDIKYTAHEMLHSNATMILTEDFNRKNYEKINSIIVFKKDAQKYNVLVIENEDKIECSNEYSEDIVRTKSIIKDNLILFQNELQDSITELTVSMNKYFLQKTVTEKGKWIVTKVEYDKVVNLSSIKNKELKLELKNNFNNKLTKSIIFVNNEPVGFIYFSLI